MNLYRICWRSEKTSYNGAGEWMDDKEWLEALTRRLNQKYSIISHWIESYVKIPKLKLIIRKRKR